MIIATIETFPLSIPFKPGTVSADPVWGDKESAAADSSLVKVTTDDGLEGLGEVFGEAGGRRVNRSAPHWQGQSYD